MEHTSPHPSTTYDVIVIGAGHAGCEAALASARMGSRTLMIAPNLDRIGFMPCNPSIGGPGKSQIVAEVDALGGAMAMVADMTAMQVRQLNMSKGPAVRAIRVQCDKSLYAAGMKRVLESQPRLDIVQDEAVGLITDTGSAVTVAGVATRTLGRVHAAAVVVTAGTFLRARMIAGEVRSSGGRAGDAADTTFGASLSGLGLRLRRFKTGTPPRVDVRSIDVGPMEPQWGDEEPLWLSRPGRDGAVDQMILPAPSVGPFATTRTLAGRRQVACFQTWTNEAVHEVIRHNLHRAPMYNGSIDGTGPRYCPSIEDKVGRFTDKASHPVFVEPEGWLSGEAYIQGMSTSLPPDVQADVLNRIPGLRDARITRFGYAVEYDALDATQLTRSLECRSIPGLFFAGQVNGTSGYEEAAGQGVVAGANAAASVKALPPLMLSRSDAYIGVMIDDLVSIPIEEPYRMLTSRAEYRLVLRADTADARLGPEAARLNLVSPERVSTVADENGAVEATLDRLSRTWLGDSHKHHAALRAQHLDPSTRSMTALDLVRRPGASLSRVIAACTALDLWRCGAPAGYALERAEIAAKYGSFIEKEEREVRRQSASERSTLPLDLDFSGVAGLRVEARQRLQASRPLTIGQAKRTAGVTPSDIGALLVHLASHGSTAGIAGK